ncbi:MAG: ABC transporter substrate-binding protein [Gemmatimonadales bacterium]
MAEVNPCRRLAAALVGTSLLLGACNGRDADPRPGVLIAAIPGAPAHLNPAITTNGGVHAAADLLYDGLLGLDEQQRPVPALATRWEVLDGGAQYVFHLRQGVRWHDGQAFSAADVVYSFTDVLLRFHSRTRASLGPVVDSIVAPDDSTVVFHLRQPYAPLLQQLDVVEAPILPRHVYAGTDPQINPANNAPVGTGPFRFVESRPGAELRYAANPDYFGGAPGVSQLILRVIPDPGTQVIALEAGEVDWLYGVPGAERARLLRTPHLKFIETALNAGGSNCVTTVAFNLDRPVFHDVRMRRALTHAVDRQQFADRVLFAQGTAASGPIASALVPSPSGNVVLPAHDPRKAGELLDALGWHRPTTGMRVARDVAGVPDGTPLLVSFKQLASFAAYGDLLRAQWRAVGVDLSIETLETAVFVEDVFTARNFDTAIISYCNGFDPQIGVRRQYASASIGPVPFSNAAGYRDAVMDSLFDAAGSTLDPAARSRTYDVIQRRAVDSLPYLWLTDGINTRAYRDRCTGLSPGPHFAARARCGQ